MSPQLNLETATFTKGKTNLKQASKLLQFLQRPPEAPQTPPSACKQRCVSCFISSVFMPSSSQLTCERLGQAGCDLMVKGYEPGSRVRSCSCVSGSELQPVTADIIMKSPVKLLSVAHRSVKASRPRLS